MAVHPHDVYSYTLPPGDETASPPDGRMIVRVGLGSGALNFVVVAVRPGVDELVAAETSPRACHPHVSIPATNRSRSDALSSLSR